MPTKRQLTLSANDDVRRILLNFDLSALQGNVASADINSAVITLTVQNNDGNWGKGKKGRINLHQMDVNAQWDSSSATWHCEQDENLANSDTDCNNTSSGGYFDSRDTAYVDGDKATSGVVQLKST
jgi:hypothetical protein